MDKHIIKFKETSREQELEFYSNNFLSENRVEFVKIEEAKNFPLIQQIFYLPFVKKVVLNKRSVYIEKLNILEWNDVQNELCKQIQDFLNNGGLVNQGDTKKASPTTVYAESTPNPNVMKFVVNRKIVRGVYEFKNVSDAKNAPIVQSLFTFPFVKEVFLDFNFISVTQKPESNWEENTMDVREFIRSYIQDDNILIHEDLVEESSDQIEVDLENIDDVSKEIIDIIEKHVKPAVAADGGNIVFQSYDQESKNVNVILQGACSGCPSSTVTLKSGIENMLKEMLPGMISEVNAING
jgi:Fe-S cluster biogenesis protein NfuA|tara:strand:- start:2667 stop:3554 length:888 start_codon:yes stop_codon:yes gene_type:complete